VSVLVLLVLLVLLGRSPPSELRETVLEGASARERARDIGGAVVGVRVEAGAPLLARALLLALVLLLVLLVVLLPLLTLLLTLTGGDTKEALGPGERTVEQPLPKPKLVRFLL